MRNMSSPPDWKFAVLKRKFLQYSVLHIILVHQNPLKTREEDIPPRSIALPGTGPGFRAPACGSDDCTPQPVNFR